MRAFISTKLAERYPLDSGDDSKAHLILWDAPGSGRNQEHVVGFGLRYFPDSRTKTFLLKFRVKGTSQLRTIKIGRFGDPWTVELARKKARDLKIEMEGGTDPVKAREDARTAKRNAEAKAKAESTTLRQIMERYVTEKRTNHGPLRPSTVADIRKHCEKNLTAWLDLPVKGITPEMCLAKFREITKRGAPTQANCCMVYLKAMCNYARVTHRNGNDYPVLPINPVNMMFEQEKRNPRKAKKRRLPLTRFGFVWHMLRDRADHVPDKDEQTSIDYVSLMLMSGLRKRKRHAKAV